MAKKEILPFKLDGQIQKSVIKKTELDTHKNKMWTDQY